MAIPHRQTTGDLIDQLAKNPYGYDFYAAVRLLQCRFDSHQRIGYSRSAGEDPVRFAQSPAMDFAPSTIEGVRHQNPARPPVFYSRHFGLFGPHGPLPLCLTEYARDRIQHHGDTTLTAFCNVFNHRFVSFFFRAWADANKTVDLDRVSEENWSQYMGSLVGVGMESLHERDAVPDAAKFYYAGRIIPQNRNAEGLAAIVGDFFEVKTRVMTFVGRWVKLESDSKKGASYVCRLGQSPESSQLGSSLIVGNKTWTCQLHFRLRLGPMSLAEFERFLPIGSSFKRLQDWVRFYNGDEHTWDAQLVLNKREIPELKLGQSGRLGWTTWLKTKPLQHDADNVVLTGSGA